MLAAADGLAVDGALGGTGAVGSSATGGAGFGAAVVDDGVTG